MFGNNAVTTVAAFEDLRPGVLLVNSIFYTIQGEGPDAGRPAVFVRLAKCNLRCYFCDTEFEKSTLMSDEQVMEAIQKEAAKGRGTVKPLVVVTGGEPLLQSNLRYLGHFLALGGWELAIETAGTVLAPFLLETVARVTTRVVCSPKTPQINKELEPYINCFKYVVAEGRVDEDGLPNCSTQWERDYPESPTYKKSSIYRQERRLKPIYISPMDEGDPDKNKRNRELAAQICMKHGYRLSLQMHKLVGVP